MLSCGNILWSIFFFCYCLSLLTRCSHNPSRKSLSALMINWLCCDDTWFFLQVFFNHVSTDSHSDITFNLIVNMVLKCGGAD